jgi:hypothetical protein
MSSEKEGEGEGQENKKENDNDNNISHIFTKAHLMCAFYFSLIPMLDLLLPAAMGTGSSISHSSHIQKSMNLHVQLYW